MQKLPVSVQENVITLLAYSEKGGKIVYRLVSPELFEGEYQVIAERCSGYWRDNNAPPRVHTSDLFADILGDPKNKRRRMFETILSQMAALSAEVNEEFVVTQVRRFVRLQRMKEAITDSARKLTTRQELGVDEVEKIWTELLRSREHDFDTGMTLLNPERVIDYVTNQGTEFVSGIKTLDQRYITPARGALTVFLGAAGAGKSWFLVQAAKENLLQRKKVLYVSLELSEEEVGLRMYQSLFAISKRPLETRVTKLVVDRFGRLEGFDFEDVEPEFHLQSPLAREELRTRLSWNMSRFNNLIIKRFPTRWLTMDRLYAYLDNLEATIRFVPDMLIIDYVAIMNTDERNHRISLGRLFENIRGLSIERNLALVTAHQLSKKGAEAYLSGATHAAEDWSIVGTVDQLYAYSCTEHERQLGLGRMHVSKARTESDKFSLLMTQNYGIGQFCLDSVPLDSRYTDIVKSYGMNTLEEGASTTNDEDGSES